MISNPSEIARQDEGDELTRAEQEVFMREGIAKVIQLAERLGVKPMEVPNKRTFIFMAVCSINHGPKYELLDIVDAVEKMLEAKSAPEIHTSTHPTLGIDDPSEFLPKGESSE